MAAYEERDITPMNERLTAPWGIRISKKDVEKLMAGLEAEDMDDKWDVVVEKHTDKDGSVSVHFVRSWTGDEIYILHLEGISDDLDRQDGGAKVGAITWDGDKNDVRIDAEQAQKEVVHLARVILSCEFDELPKYDPSKIHDHPAYRLDARKSPTN
ncbi:hypothetical protein PpBr36_02410 [Pyricularia pennisetigena]|uniref:hypothetical protein n=1 Tax=Pyricularia pennisetigena TaxID=1578925 RepID=UPI00114F45F7|nr:hypothetical protein PpBr36_02410 [Pyricularia pennisetigena]TLS31179.1 hypothetical protein PpBr36_02410 [Pyricularia pennisetigena]